MTLDELIIKHNFIVKVTPVDDQSLLVTFGKEFISAYSIYDDEHSGVVFVDKDDKAVEALDLPRHILRLYILCDIYRRCKQRNLPYEIVRFFEKDESPSTLLKILPMQMDESEIALETTFQEYILSIYSGNVKKINRIENQLEEINILHHGLLLKGLIV